MNTQKMSQKEKFIQAAKELECDESEEAFNAKLKAVAKKKDGDKAPASSK